MYARIIAIINLVSSEVAVDICQLLKNEFKYQVAKRDQINIESKIKVVRFIGELVKFELYSKLEALMCLKILLYNFQHHQIEMACSFFEVCGSFLYNNAETHIRTNAYLEKMMRLKTVHSLESRHSAQIDNCYYLIKPPEAVNVSVVKEKPVPYLYIQHLLYEELSKHNVENILRFLRRYNYEDAAVSAQIVKYLTKAYKVRFNLIKHLADILSGLFFYQEKLVAKVIDSVFEDVRASFEISSPKLAQRQISMITYLGEIYNYRLINANDIINTLYLIISLGVKDEFVEASDGDAPNSMFRLKLACILLHTCGSYFTKSLHRKK